MKTRNKSMTLPFHLQGKHRGSAERERETERQREREREDRNEMISGHGLDDFILSYFLLSSPTIALFLNYNQTLFSVSLPSLFLT
jgi:hypothetical protein